MVLTVWIAIRTRHAKLLHQKRRLLKTRFDCVFFCLFVFHDVYIYAMDVFLDGDEKCWCEVWSFHLIGNILGRVMQFLTNELSLPSSTRPLSPSFLLVSIMPFHAMLACWFVKPWRPTLFISAALRRNFLLLISVKKRKGVLSLYKRISHFPTNLFCCNPGWFFGCLILLMT